MRRLNKKEKEAERRKELERALIISKKKSYDQVWCVFDKDDFDDIDFNKAIQLAEKYNFKSAYSNQAFEYWLILHFNDHQGGAIHRNRYDSLINNYLKPFKLSYNSNSDKLVSYNFFNLLFGTDNKYQERRIDLAIKRAKRNYQYLHHLNPAKEESSTTVFRLVEEILKYI